LGYSTSPPAIGGAHILGVLPAAGTIAGLWIGGLQAIVAYLIVSRLHTRRMRDQAKADAETLRRSRELVRTRDAIIFGLAKLAESRDADTGHHLERISLYSTRLAAELRRSAKYREKISPSFVRLIGISSALHDIGKVGIRDAVLLKSGKLNAAEFKHIQTHTAIGGDCLRLIERRLGESNFLEMAREIALHHHERWDGRGYPSGLAGEQIPLAARIVAIADVYDALSQKRCYRDPLPHEACVDFIRENAGAHFDPELVEVFLRVAPQFREIARQYAAHREALTPPSETPGEPALAGAAGIGN
jgi:putative two-component system response regulator